MASLKFRHYATESALKGNGTVQNALNAFDVGTIVFIDDTQKQYIITSKSNNVVTYKIYYGKAAVVGVSGTDAARILTFSDGSEIKVTINNVEHAASSDTANTAKSVAWNNVTGKPTNFVTTDGTQTITGSKIFTNNVSLQGSTSADSITAEDLIVNGAARFVSGLTGDLKGNVVGNVTGNVTGNVSGSSGSCTGNALTATTLQTARSINGTSFNGSQAITTAKWGTARNITIADNTNEHTQVNNSIDGSANFTLKLPATIKANIIGNSSTADSAKAVAWANVTNKPNLVTTDTEQIITGAKIFNNNTTFKNETDIESLTADSLLVTGSARFTNTINGNLKGNVEGNLTGNASTATTAATATEFSTNKAVTLTGDVTGSASSKGGWSIATTIANGAVTNAKLANSKITIAGTAVNLGGSIAASTIGAALTTSAPAAYATNAGTATKAAEAEKAIKDSDGNVINTTYIKTVTLASGTNNGTLKLTVGGTTTDNIAVKGLGSAAYTDSESYAKASHIHNYLPLSGGQMNNTAFIAWNSGADGNDLEDWSITNNGLRIISSTSTTSKAPTQYATGLHVKGRYGFQIASQGGNTSNEFFIKNIYNTIWNTLLHSNNYTSYTVKKDGTGASGTWGINITGNASSATKATNDGNGNAITSTYATKTERANNDITAASLTATKLTLTRATGNITANIPTWNQDTTGTAAKATADAKGNNIINTYATKAEVAALPKSMVIKGTLDATHALPTSGMTEGDTYIVGASGTYNKIACKVGDFFVRTSNSWLRIPAGDEWEYNENTIKGIKVNNTGHADTADTAVSAGTATNADKLGNLNADNYFKQRDAVFNSDWGGKFLWTLWDNHLYAADKRFAVTLTGTGETNLSYLFDGSFESSVSITETKAVLHIKHTTAGNVWTSGLPYGSFYVVFYNSDAENVTGRVYCKYEQQGIGWHDLTVTHVRPHVWELDNGYYQLSDLEITITKPASSTSIQLCQVLHEVVRSSSPKLAAVMSKYCDQKTDYNIEAAKFIGPLQGNATTASSCSGNSATATKAGYLDTGGMTLYAHGGNEINFGGTNASSTIYFGYRATESKPIPTSFIFGGSTGTATLTAGGFKKKDSNASYVLTGDGGHAKISGLSVNYAASSGSCSGNSATVTNGVYTNTAQTITGYKVFQGSTVKTEGDTVRIPLALTLNTFSDTGHNVAAIGFANEGRGWYKGFFGYERTGPYDTGAFVIGLNNTFDDSSATYNDVKFRFDAKGNLTATKFTGNLDGNATTSSSCSGNSATATKATQDSDGNIINTTYLKRSGGTVTGNVTFNSSVTTDNLTTEDLIVNGAARFVSGLTGDLVGNVTGNLTGTASYATSAGTATTAGDANTIGGISISKLVYGSNSTKTTNITEDQLNAPLASGFYTISNTTTGSSATIPNATSISMILHTSYSGPDNNAGFDLLINDSQTSSLHFRPATGSGKGAWKTLIDTGNIELQSVNYATTSGACTGNAATATKLQTPRTIWGQSFDGSRNISGDITSTGNIRPSATKTSNLGSDALSYKYVYATWFGAPSSTAVSFGAANATHLTIGTSGNVGIGTTSPTSKLHVAGTGYFASDVSSASNIIAGGYIKGETVKISSGCTLEYSSSDKCVRFVFN